MFARQGLIILGMHRSGTSALAGTAVRLGFGRPRTELQASADNPDGFYESRPLVLVNHEILLQAHCTWNLCLHFKPEILAAGLPAPLKVRLGQVLESEFSGQAAFVVKDPRLCITLPAWLPEFAPVGAAPVVLLLARHPAEVMHSLSLRNNQKLTESLPHWLHHMLEAEFASRGFKRAVVLYDGLLQDWRRALVPAGQVAGITWPWPMQAAGPAIDGFLRHAARHHRVPNSTRLAGMPPVDEMVNAAWEAFCALAAQPEDAGWRGCLDQIRARFAVWRQMTVPPGFRAVLQQV